MDHGQERGTESGRRVRIASGRKECRGDARDALVEQGTKNLDRIEGTLTTRAEHRREGLLRLRRERCAIATADFTIRHRGAERLFGAPIGGVNRGLVQEAEERGPLAIEMRGKALHGRNRAALVEHGCQARLHVPARHRQAMGRDRPHDVPVAQRQGLLQHGLYLERERGARVIDL